MNPWPHQITAVESALAGIAAGQRRLCVTSPTGGGKTLVMQMLASHFLEERKKVILYTNRRMLIDQTSEALAGAGIFHGVRAAGYEDEREHDFQVSSIQTEHSRVHRKKTWHLHDADLVLIDEAHVQTGDVARQLLTAHQEAGAACVGFTATPIGLAGLYDHLIVAGTTGELRHCGALIPAIHFAPDEPDMKAFKKLREGEDLSETQQRKAMMVPGLFGRVWEHFEKLNPEHKPTILFAPGVAESIWFAEQFSKKGVRAAHIDGQDVWLDGRLHKTSSSLRNDVLEGSRDGGLVVLCNRFVLREGIDAPWLSHGIFATVFGSLQSYLQSGGRLLRAHHSLDSITIQDHGGNYWRHGSLNEDREWSLEYTASMIYGLRAERIRTKRQHEPFRCPKCGRVWTVGTRCQPVHGGCGYELGSNKRSRPVVSTDGSLKEMTGSAFKPRRISQKPNGVSLWEKMYWRSRTDKGSRTFAQAMALFAYENDWGWPDPRWPLMPTVEIDRYRLVRDVPIERLTK